MPVVTNGLPMHLVAGWIISGLWIDFGDVGLHVSATVWMRTACPPNVPNRATRMLSQVKPAIALCVTAGAEPEREKCGQMCAAG
jgi:hypothetical protein